MKPTDLNETRSKLVKAASEFKDCDEVYFKVFKEQHLELVEVWKHADL